MPFTPFHFGPGAAIKAVCPRRFSFTIFVAAQVITDLEPGYYLWRNEPPFHRWAHTYLGAVVVGLITAVVAGPLVRVGHRWMANRAIPLAAWWAATNLSWRVILGSALVGTLSHVLLDSPLHTDMHPFAPFSAANPVLGMVSLRAIHYGCIASGVAACIYGALFPPKIAGARLADAKKPETRGAAPA